MTTFLTRKDLPAHLQPLHTQGQIKAVPTLTVTIPSDTGLWSSGTRTLYGAVELATGRTHSLSDSSAPWSPDRQTRTVTLKPGFAIIQTGSFCGKPAGLTFHMHPDDVAQILPAPAVDLSPDAAAVLEVTAAYKSAYRAERLRRAGLTDGRVAAAKAALQDLALIDARGAITVKGRNVRAANQQRALLADVVPNF